MCHYCGCRAMPLIRDYVAEHERASDLGDHAIRAIDQGDLGAAGESIETMAMLAGSDPNGGLFAYSRSTTQTLISVYAMRMAAVFTLSVSTVGLRTSGLPRWVSTSAIWWR